MKRIVICLDGTWNTILDPEEVTNVVKFAQSVDTQASTSQIVYYNSGVGSGGRLDRFLGGAFGFGIKGNVLRAYAFLTLNYQEGDEIYIVGSSRGAYTARALGAIINAVGVLKRHNFRRFEEAWNYYRVPPETRHAEKARIDAGAGRAPERRAGGGSERQKDTVRTIEDHRQAWFWPAEVTALGVWDTVGSYGIPSGFGLSSLATRLTRHNLNFHDRQLGANVRHAFHAVAIDETRRPFEPTFWTHVEGTPPPPNVEQVWFPGVHSDVGGGYRETGLSDLALVWMADRMAAVGLQFDLAVLRELADPCPSCQLHRSDRGWWRAVAGYRRPLFDNRPDIRDRKGRIEKVINERLHWSVAHRVRSGGMAGLGQARDYALAGIGKDRLEALPTSALGPLEAEIYGMPPKPTPPKDWHLDHNCWTKGPPDSFLARGSGSHPASAAAA